MGRYLVNEGGKTVEIDATTFTVRDEAVIFLRDDGTVVLQLPVGDVESVERLDD